jgi:hypothetical protein
MVCKEDMYQAYIAMCQAEGWPLRYMHHTLGKAVKHIFPMVSTGHLCSCHCVKQYYVGLCLQLQQQPQLCCWSTANTNNINNNCGDCWVDGLQGYPSSLLLWQWCAYCKQPAPAAEHNPHKPMPGLGEKSPSAPHRGLAVDDGMTQRLQRPQPPTGDYRLTDVKSTRVVGDDGEAELWTRCMPGPASVCTLKRSPTGC